VPGSSACADIATTTMIAKVRILQDCIMASLCEVSNQRSLTVTLTLDHQVP
jgi:hypothetical protein